ncbi:uncharacterized protein LOC115216253 [Octopus sinensis]|uniref:Uncharacterized protein LOC115216253 n=1 Tax=Octopus sinensis TaxID=2607531 RepID=A0A6P7SSR0_9MOLL|nr:uncharacterized protein LOC115216253 [Octopus sinensis]
MVNAITEFSCNPEEGITFLAYFRRYEETFKDECKCWTDDEKVKLLLQELDASEHGKYCNFILSKKTSEICFEETIELLSKMFSDKSSLFNTHWECLNLVKEEDEDFVIYIRIVNKMCGKFKLKELSPDIFKCLIFVQGLMANKDAEIHAQILTKLEQEDQNLSLHAVAEECQRIINLRQDVKKIKGKKFSQVQTCRLEIKNVMIESMPWMWRSAL